MTGNTTGKPLWWGCPCKWHMIWDLLHVKRSLPRLESRWEDLRGRTLGSDKTRHILLLYFPVSSGFPIEYTFKMHFLCSPSPINHFAESQYRIKRQQEGEIFIKIKISKELLSEYFHCLWYLFSSKFLNIFNNSLNN